MTFNVYIEYPNGEKKLKGKCRLQETAEAAVEYYEKAFSRGGFTRAPSGEQFRADAVLVYWTEE